MFDNFLRKIATFVRVPRSKNLRRQKLPHRLLLLESLETRNLPAPLTWAVGASLPAPEAGIAVQTKGTGLLALAGPSTTSYNVSVVDPAWKTSFNPTVQALDFARTSPGAGPLPNGDYLVFGGSQNGFAIANVTQYDPNTPTVVDGTTNQTRALRSMNAPRALLGWATDTSDLSYAIGGQDNNGTPLATMEVYNPTANTWTYLASLPQTLYSEAAVSDGAGHIYTFGGVGANGTIISNAYRYTIATNTWDQVAPLQVGVRDSAAVLAASGQIYVLGGTTSAGTTATVESYNIATNTWTLQSSLPQALSSAAAVADSLGRIEVLGGYDVNGNPLASIYVSQELTQPDLAPTITSTPGTSVLVNAGYSYQVLTSANPAATYTLNAAPSGMQIDPNTGLITWTPNYATESSQSVTVVASNSVGQTTQTFSISVAPQTPTGLSGVGTSKTSISLSWNASTDPNVTGYNLYRRTFVHSPRGSGGSYVYSRVASNISSSSVTISGSSASGTYLVSAANSAGVESARSGVVTVATFAPPDLFTATTTSGADISSLTLNVGQTGQIYLVQEFANPAPTFSLVSGPGGITVDPTTGLVTYTPSPADIGYQSVVFAATNAAGTSTYTFLYDVLALNPTVTVNGGPFTYDGTPDAAAATALGVDGVTPVGGSFSFTYDGSPTPPTAAGIYDVTATFTSNDPSYANSVGTGTLMIYAATPTISVSSGPFNYDGTPQSATATDVGADGITPVNGIFQITYNGDPNPPTGPGLYSVATTFYSNDPNYNSVAVTNSMIVYSPGTLSPTMSLVDGSAPYDGNVHADSASAVAADNVTPVAGDFIITYNGSPAAPTQVGTYAVVATFISSDINYADATISTTMTISPVVPTLSVDPTPFIYDGSAHNAVVSALGVDQITPVDGAFTVTYNGFSTPPVDAGTYNVAVTFNSNDPNYLSTSTTSTLTILPATSSVGLGNGGQWEFTYNGLPQTVTGSAVGIDGLTPINGYFTYDYYNEYGSNTQLFGPPLPGAPTNAGSYTFVETFTSQDPNYAGGTFSWCLLIDPASPTLSMNSGPFTYNGSTRPAIVSALGVDGVTPVAGSLTYVTYNGSTNAPSTVGIYDVFAEFTSGDPNYYSSTIDGSFVINKATPAFSSLSSPAVNVGATTVTVSGHVAAGSVAPGGDDVAITLNGVTKPVSISSNGSFTTTFNIQGLTTGTYPITYEYLGDASRFNAAGTGFASGMLTVRAAPSILINPASQSVVSGASVTFSTSASGYPTPTVQWQVSTNGNTYSNIGGATSSTYTISAATASQNGYRYRAVFTNSVGSATTAVATLTVQSAPAVTTNPKSTTINAGQTATLTAAATGNPTPTVQWQVSTNGGITFTNISGATSATLTLSGTTASQNGAIYHAVFSNSVGSATTANATLMVRYAPIIISNPTNQSVSAGQSATFTAVASGNPAATVQWQVSTNGGTSFSNISGATSATLTLSSTTTSQNGYRYRAVFTNSLGSVTTAVVVLTVM
jgi:MBG domain/Kelch motif/Immunoglobulin domain/Galactose oxidase, central domain